MSHKSVDTKTPPPAVAAAPAAVAKTASGVTAPASADDVKGGATALGKYAKGIAIARGLVKLIKVPKTRPEVMKRFIDLAKKTSLEFAQLKPADKTVQSCNRRFVLACNNLPQDVISAFGYYFEEFKDDILKFNIDMFLLNDFKNEIDEGVDAQKKELAALAIPILQGHYRNSDPDKQGELLARCVELLRLYEAQVL